MSGMVVGLIVMVHLSTVTYSCLTLEISVIPSPGVILQSFRLEEGLQLRRLGGHWGSLEDREEEVFPASLFMAQ
jgi:hypothetical protein